VTSQVLTPSGVLLERPLVPGSAEWLSRMSASKIAAVVGLSPYESRYSLWMRMAGLVPQQEQTSAMSRGHYLEPAIAAWFADQHPDWTITPTGTFQHPRHEWMVASPDRQVEARRVLDSIAAGERPDIDAHSATYEAVRQLHPDIADEKVDVPAELAVAFLEACEAERDAKAAKRLASSLLAEEMGSAKAAYHAGVCVARRQCKGDGPPFLVPARNVNLNEIRSAAA
jgi:putative phage-type endonuclease